MNANFNHQRIKFMISRKVCYGILWKHLVIMHVSTTKQDNLRLIKGFLIWTKMLIFLNGKIINSLPSFPKTCFQYYPGPGSLSNFPVKIHVS